MLHHRGDIVLEERREVSGKRVKWDDELWRLEAALGYRLIREILVKLDWQHTEFVTGANVPLNLLALQLSAVF